MKLLFSKDSLTATSYLQQLIIAAWKRESKRRHSPSVTWNQHFKKCGNNILQSSVRTNCMLMLKKVPWSLRTQGPTTFAHWFLGLEGAWQYIHKVNVLYLFLRFSVRNQGIPDSLTWNGAKMIVLIWWLHWLLGRAVFNRGHTSLHMCIHYTQPAHARQS